MSCDVFVGTLNLLNFNYLRARLAGEAGGLFQQRLSLCVCVCCLSEQKLKKNYPSEIDAASEKHVLLRTSEVVTFW